MIHIIKLHITSGLIPGIKYIIITTLNLFLSTRFRRQVVLIREMMRTIVRIKPKIWRKLISGKFAKPYISVLLPVYNTESEILERCICSVQNQVYANWQLCIVDDASTCDYIRPLLESIKNRRHKVDKRIKIQYAFKNRGIAKTINKAAQMATGDFICVLDHDDELSPLALFEVALAINEHPDVDLIYTDEDKVDENGHHCDPAFKSDWNPDLALSFNYVMHLAVYRRFLFNAIGGFQKAYEGSQDYDLLLRTTEITDKIIHVPRICYHWHKIKGSIATHPDEKPHVFITGLAALNHALRRRHISGQALDAPDAWKGVYRVKRDIVSSHHISIIVGYKGNPEALTRLVNSICEHLPNLTYEILIAPFTRSKDQPLDLTNTLKPTIDAASPSIRSHILPNIKWISDIEAVSFPKLFNLLAQKAQGDMLLFLDQDMAFDSTDTLESLVEQAQRQKVGAAGGKVLYQNGLIEHAGVILGPYGVIGYAHRGHTDRPGHEGMKNMIRNFSAVMGWGMMTRKDVFESVLGFDTHFENAYWDIDYCLRLGQKGYLVTYTPYARFKHDIPVTPLSEFIIQPDADLLKQRWAAKIARDPFYHPNYLKNREDFAVTGYP